MSIDIKTLRKDTPACAELIHFNNAGAALAPQAVTDAVITHLTNEQRLGGYEAANLAEAQINRCYGAFAKLLNCDASEIAYAENATHAWNSLFNAIPFSKDDIILTGQSEYASNFLALLHLAKRQGVKIEVIPNDRTGTIDLERLEAAINSRVKLIALTHVPSQSGVIHPAASVGALARTHNILYLLDACQSVGQIDLNVETLGCDMLTGTGRKYLRGPRGSGFLYLRRSSMPKLEPAWIDLHSAAWTSTNTYEFRDDARRFENWECFVAGKIGLGVAVDYAMQIGMPAIEKRVGELGVALRETLGAITGVQVHEHGSHLSGIVTFSKQRVFAAALQEGLRAKGINTSVARLASNQLDLAQRGLSDINRASVHYYNTHEEIARFGHAIAQF